MSGRVYPPIHVRLAAQLDKRRGLGPNGDCWFWTGHVLRSGYAQIKHLGRAEFIHRVAYELHHSVRLRRVRDGGLLVCHQCDVRHCANPVHLFLGTNTDNMQDMIAKGRQVIADQRGIANPCSKLTDDQVRSIRRDDRRLADVAATYDVSPALVSMIRNGHRWSHLRDYEGAFS